MNCETRKRGKLCGRDECKPCFERSFASCDKAKYLAEGQGNPLLLARNSNKKYTFKCGVCSHPFEASLNNVFNERFCPFCSNNKLCFSSGCMTCFEKSFASSNKARFWSIEKNKQSPREVFACSRKKCWFVCPTCEHSFKASLSDIYFGCFCPFCSDPPQKLCGTLECGTCFEKSFASHEKAEFWDFEKNKQTPRDVFANSNKMFWFKCETCKHLFEARPNSVSKGSFCPFCSNKQLCLSDECEICFEKSFASSNKARFWSIEKNKQRPRGFFVSSGKKFWFECEVCEHAFQSILRDISRGSFCPFCSSDELCLSDKCEICFEKSFASSDKAEFWDIEKNKQRPRGVFTSSHEKFWFNCGTCKHPFKASLNGVSRGRFCPFCSNQKLCSLDECGSCFKKSFASSDKAEFWSVEKNKQSPREVFVSSGKKFWFECGKGHKFSSVLYSVSSGTWCPVCKNKTETKLFSFLEKHFKDPIHQFKVSWCKNPETNNFLPFDFCVSKTIIELDGAQHYKQVSNWQSPELIQKSDRYKEEQAIKNGYSVLRILQEDVWNDKIDWKSLLLEHIKDYETPVVKNLWEINKEQ
ncbi:restriction endonuclease [Insectomime virus]|nr:restriction endonuclease [Insectomime virus]